MHAQELNQLAQTPMVGPTCLQSAVYQRNASLVGDDSWYDHETSTKVAALAADDSSIRNEFVQNVFKNHDFGFVHTVLIRAGVESEPPTERITKP